MDKKIKAALEKLPDVEILARTLYGEARNQGVEGLTAVANVINNRMLFVPKRYGVGIYGVCLKAKQFSCWNEKDANFSKITHQIAFDGAEVHVWHRCRIIAILSIRELLKDNTCGATHYHHFKSTPWWIESNFMHYLCQIGDHKFYREV